MLSEIIWELTQRHVLCLCVHKYERMVLKYIRPFIKSKTISIM